MADNTFIDLSSFVRVDKLKLYFGDNVVINNKITLKQPTIGDIVEFGEVHFYSVLTALTCIPSDLKSELWDLNHTDWQTVDDFDLFVSMTRSLTADDTKLFFDNLDLSKMQIMKNTLNDQPCLYDVDTDTLIDKAIYYKIVTYIREMFHLNPKVEKAKNNITFRVMIDYDRMQKNNRKNNTSDGSMLLPLISSMLNSPGFKYKKNELRDVGIVEFMDSVQRIPTIVSTTALLNGMYSGFVDTSKIKSEQFNWMRDLSNEGKEHNGVMNIKQ